MVSRRLVFVECNRRGDEYWIDGNINSNTAVLCVEDQATHRVEMDPNRDHPLGFYIAWYVYVFSIFSFDSIQLDWRIAGGVWTAIKIIVVKRFSLKYQLETPAMVWFLTSCVADLLITVTLVIYLVRLKPFLTGLIHELGTRLVKATNWFRANK